jgi:hypothetical protein
MTAYLYGNLILEILMTHVFKCHSNSNRYGFTKDRTGANLPVGDVCSGWDYFKQGDLSKEPLIGINNKEAIAAVEAQGLMFATLR